MYNIIGIIISLASAYYCYQKAPQLKLHPIVGGLLGLFFSLISVLIFWLLGRRR